MKKTGLFAFVLALIISVGVIGVPAAAGSEGRTLEGPGYDTPEDAVLAYLDCMNRADVSGMLSVFALESLMEHLDVTAYLMRIRAVNQITAYAFPAADAYTGELLLYNRYAKLAESLYQQYLNYSTALNGTTMSLMEQADLDAYYAQLDASPLRDLQGKVAFIGWVSPIVLTEGRLVHPVNGANLAGQILYAGPDDAMELAAWIRIGDAFGIQMFQLVRYGDRWYILDLSGMTGSILGMGSMLGGLMLLTDQTDAGEVAAALSSGGRWAEEQAVWDAVRASDLGGTRWRLESLSMPGVTAADTADSAAADMGLGIWAEMRFYSVGSAAVEMRVSPLLRENLGIERDAVTLGVGWAEQYGKFAVRSVRSIFDKSFRDLFKEDTAAVRDGDVITFTLPDGVQAVFRKL